MFLTCFVTLTTVPRSARNTFLFKEVHSEHSLLQVYRKTTIFSGNKFLHVLWISSFLYTRLISIGPSFNFVVTNYIKILQRSFFYFLPRFTPKGFKFISWGNPLGENLRTLNRLFNIYVKFHDLFQMY